MNERQIEALLKRIDFSKFPIRFDIQLLEIAFGCVQFGIKMHVKSVHTGEPILSGRTFQVSAAIGEERMIREIRDMLRWFVLHEVDECFEVDGVRVFDPHRK